MKIFDIQKEQNFTDDVQDNIKILLKKFGSKFNIKYKKHILLVEIHKDINLKCYALYYNIENRTYDLFPFKIIFRDPITTELNNNTYIGNIHKTENISGSDMVKIVMAINKIFKSKWCTITNKINNSMSDTNNIKNYDTYVIFDDGEEILKIIKLDMKK